ncbi:hypothetical protein [Clostridium sp. BNL1100]|uniref:hypothetical protein n=1 Tax=Clostridium sp. BNL1100 TaxID=755731 RepID=UPI00024A7F17|nr:hypothetical protein [Clostridium sp. BNL1100]AEY65424.1 hypothetical protein Clo1100_1172 [Clostridium sp. BNL1100]
MQRTIVLDYNGQKIVSQPFTFKHACIMDDQRHKAGDKELNMNDYKLWAFESLKKMFEGTILTDEILETEIKIKEISNACTKILNWFFSIDEETKNSSSPQTEQEPGVGD